ncbi:hypothetical protein X975_05680, partial [Stegodyphus mimosarum]
MSSRLLKQTRSKQKQITRKGQRNQVSDTKAKHEMEADSKGLMSELEKEIYAIKINELETKLSRKK